MELRQHLARSPHKKVRTSIFQQSFSTILCHEGETLFCARGLSPDAPTTTTEGKKERGQKDSILDVFFDKKARTK